MASHHLRCVHYGRGQPSLSLSPLSLALSPSRLHTRRKKKSLFTIKCYKPHIIVSRAASICQHMFVSKQSGHLWWRLNTDKPWEQLPLRDMPAVKGGRDRTGVPLSPCPCSINSLVNSHPVAPGRPSPRGTLHSQPAWALDGSLGRYGEPAEPLISSARLGSAPHKDWTLVYEVQRGGWADASVGQ